MKAAVIIEHPMKFDFFGKKSKCVCGKKFKNDAELMDHQRASHTA
jgi:hypothetical protein